MGAVVSPVLFAYKLTGACLCCCSTERWTLALFHVCEATPLYPSIGDDNMLLSAVPSTALGDDIIYCWDEIWFRLQGNSLRGFVLSCTRRTFFTNRGQNCFVPIKTFLSQWCWGQNSFVPRETSWFLTKKKWEQWPNHQEWFFTTRLNGFIFTLSFSHKKEMGSKKHTADVVLPVGVEISLSVRDGLKGKKLGVRK